MTTTQALYVLEVAACRSMSRAAQRLYVSQSAISQQIQKLEQELGCFFKSSSKNARALPERVRESRVPISQSSTRNMACSSSRSRRVRPSEWTSAATRSLALPL